MRTYGPEPQNLTDADVRRIVHETLRSPSSVGSYAPQSIPWSAVIAPLSGANLGSGRTGDYGFTPLTTAPSGALICDGTAVSRSTYAALFALLSTSYGSGDGSTTFNLPDWDGVFLAGATGGTYTVGDTGGADTVTLTSSEIPGHVHTGPSHTHQVAEVVTSNTGGTAGAFNMGVLTGSTVASGSGGTGNTGSTGGGGAHENRPPFLAVTVYIWT